MYENRFIAFIDLLGFGSLVEKSATDNDLPGKIFSALSSLQPKTIEEEAYASINHELCPPEELENVRALLKRMTQNMKALHPVTITYFSDSLVISALSDDVISSQMILDLLAKLSIKLWSEHSLLLRGGITEGKLIHQEGGPLFGPAMNRAYYLESKLAINPRILIDNECITKYRSVETFQLFESFFEFDGEFNYASLGTAYRHILNDSSLVLAGEEVLWKFRKTLAETTGKLSEIREHFEDERVKDKYTWLIEEVSRR
ncbi:hypothetical protein [Perlucidibaca piscinae]|uniref:hypothetical protein n=1 Tax=Perlucidibaca piscinae TaxID=392589 RepID=UPI0012EC7811|nr:hypothetical protein [Perlucidibaca piscinae]